MPVAGGISGAGKRPTRLENFNFESALYVWTGKENQPAGPVGAEKHAKHGSISHAGERAKTW